MSRWLGARENLSAGTRYLVAIAGRAAVNTSEMQRYVESSQFGVPTFPPGQWATFPSDGGFTTSFFVDISREVRVADFMAYIVTSAQACGGGVFGCGIATDPSYVDHNTLSNVLSSVVAAPVNILNTSLEIAKGGAKAISDVAKIPLYLSIIGGCAVLIYAAEKYG